MASPVIITRPLQQGAPLAQALRARGLEVLLLPLIEIAALADRRALDAVLARLESFTLVVFVSRNAIEHALAALPRPWPEGVPLAVIGPGSRQALAARAIGAPRYRVIGPDDGDADDAARFDSEGLLARLDIAALAGGPVLIVKGNDGREWLAQALRAKGVAVELVESYMRQAARLEPAACARLREWIAQGRTVQIVVTQRESVNRMLELAEHEAGAAGREWILAQRLLVPHPRIAQNATALGFARVDLVAPDDSHLVGALEWNQ